MKKVLLTLVYTFCLSFFVNVLLAQDFSGQWKGCFIDKSTSSIGWGGDKCDYVLELEVNGKDVTGYSYTYFTDGGKKYYTICSLKGYINKAQKYIEIRETVRTKTNVPDHIRNCFQVHKLNYGKSSSSESLTGNWVPAPNQEGNCGYGSTILERRVLKKDVSLYNKSVARSIKPAPKPAAPVARAKPVTPTAKLKPQTKSNPIALNPKKQQVAEPTEEPVAKNDLQEKVTSPSANFEKRNTSVIKTIEVENVSVKVSLYDNGEIDGDSISLFYNDKLLLSHQRLSDKPITLNINVEKGQSFNELVMYAENLGSIPPNTALMVVYDGPNRYEVRITSDLQKNGTIRFVHKGG